MSGNHYNYNDINGSRCTELIDEPIIYWSSVGARALSEFHRYNGPLFNIEEREPQYAESNIFPIIILLLLIIVRRIIIGCIWDDNVGSVSSSRSSYFKYSPLELFAWNSARALKPPDRNNGSLGILKQRDPQLPLLTQSAPNLILLLVKKNKTWRVL